jgi:hypothetical protein
MYDNLNVIFIADNKFKSRICYHSQIFKHFQKTVFNYACS